MNSRTIRQHIGMALLILVCVAGGHCLAQTESDSLSFNTQAVTAVLKKWRASQPATPPGYTLLFSTSTGTCTACCATAINHAIGSAKRAHVPVNSLVVIATPVAREGLAFRKKFRADAVAEDLSNDLAEIFHADPVFANMYLIDSTGNVVLYRHDLQHNALDTLILPDGVSAQGIPGGMAVQTKKTNALKIYSAIPLIEDDDNIITAAKSVTLDAKSGVMELLDDRQNMIYHFDSRTGKLIAAIPPDTSLALHYKKATDNPEYWSELVESYSALISYDAIGRRKGNDTAYIFSDLFTGYDVTVAGEHDTTVHWHKGASILKMVDRRIVAISPIGQSEYYMVGSPLEFGDDFISPCLWEGFSDASIPDSVRRDSLFNFMLIKENGASVKTALRTASIEDAVGVAQEAKHVGALYVEGGTDIFYLSQYNKIFMHGKRVGDEIVPEFWRMDGKFAGAVVDHNVKGMSAGYAPQDSIFVVDLASDKSRLYVLALSRADADTNTQLYIQAYDLTGRFLGERPIVTGAEKVVLAQIIGCEDGTLSLLTKRETSRWKIESLSVADLIEARN